MRTAIALRTTAGLLELAGPDRQPAARLWDRTVDDRLRLASRALAARDLATAGILASGPTRRVRVALAAVDCLHVASMLGLALASERYRRPALASAAVASALALATAA
jgi:hypothetical protein